MSIAFYNMFLVLHIMGVTLMAGTSFIDFIVFRLFLKNFREDVSKSLAIEDQLNRLQRFLGIGMLLILISGIGMMVRLHEVWGAQLWFRIKMGILLVVIFNGLALRRIFGGRLRKSLRNTSVAGTTLSIDAISSG